jgi:heterodisulfide reductase subunit B
MDARLNLLACSSCHVTMERDQAGPFGCGEIAAREDPLDIGKAEEHYRQALAVAEELGMRPLVAHCDVGLGKLYRRRGKQQQAKEHLTTATTMMREMGMGFWLEKAQAELKELG